jgi:hypothetical protein
MSATKEVLMQNKSHERGPDGDKITFSLPKSLKQKIIIIAKHDRRNVSNMITVLLEQALDIRADGRLDVKSQMGESLDPLNKESSNDVVPLRKATMDLLDAIAESEGKTRSDVIDNLIVKAVDPSIETERRGADRIVNRRHQTLTKDGFNEPQNGHHTDSGMVATARRKPEQGKTA